TEVLPVHFEHRRETLSISLSTIPLVVGLYTLGPLGLVAARLAGSAGALVLHRRQGPLKLSLNLSSFWLETATAVTVFHLLAQAHGAITFGPGTWPAAFGAAVAGDMAQTVVLIAAISLYERRWAAGFASSAAIGSIATLVDTCVALVAVTLLVAQPAALALMAVVVTMVLISYRVHRSFREKHRSLEQLYDFTSVMGDALLEGRVLVTLLEQARELMHAESAWLLLAGEDGSLVRLETDGTEVVSRPLAVDDEQLHGTAHESDQPRVVHASRPAIVGPLLGSAGPVGTLVVADRSGEVRPFAEEDLQLFATLANHASVALENADLVDRLRQQAAASRHQSLHDSLTGLPNRLMFTQQLEQGLAAGAALAVLLLDLDRFKEVNDTLGHHNGDDLLQQVGTRLRLALRQGDLIARLGGDEFGILLADIGGDEAALQVARGIVAVLERPFPLADVSVDVGASIGIAVFPQHGDEPGTLLQRADVAMYTAKEDQSSVELYRADRDEYSPERLGLVGELRHAVQTGALDVYYQPQLDLRTGRAIGAEALVRWPHPTRGLIQPDDFISIAEHTGLIRPLTLLVLAQALEQCALWRAGGQRLRLSVNLSARSLLQPTLVDDIAGLLDASGVPARSLCLELTESSIMADFRRTVAVLHRLRAIGVAIAIDDFGTGHSSLAYLKRLPVDELKIDKSFVLSMHDDPSDEAIVRTVVDLARNLRLPVVAEGVETEAAADSLRLMGCGAAQGYLYSRPVPADDFRNWLTQHSPPQRAAAVVVPIASAAGRSVRS
ncbi:MAG: hypothetical protein QOG64_943, partial [Acidimicrobiaceae bacterium]|nr:hypothetical protein [Acidimicrobiaceae bacterium]